MTATHDTPLGTLTLAASDTGLTRCAVAPTATDVGAGGASPAARALLDRARRELDAYLGGELRSVTVPVDLADCSAFDRRVLAALEAIGYGATATYAGLAAMLALPDADARRLRKVGWALARNPVLIVVPCHRIVGSDGSLVGYAGSQAAKRALLDLEACDRAPQLDLTWP
ncbi:MAG: methylated-DNA--[protein]-cysteine S-methyltransferase [Pseudonocardiaceae bacterium]|nr:methylated-DNA--[protein]-cysteine S-methyltransferase [Pseudonocardiaceae bacterium]